LRLVRGAIANVALTIRRGSLWAWRSLKMGPAAGCSRGSWSRMAIPNLAFAWGTPANKLFFARFDHVLSRAPSWGRPLHMTATLFTPRDIGFGEGFMPVGATLVPQRPCPLPSDHRLSGLWRAMWLAVGCCMSAVIMAALWCVLLVAITRWSDQTTTHRNPAKQPRLRSATSRDLALLIHLTFGLFGSLSNLVCGFRHRLCRPA